MQALEAAEHLTDGEEKTSHQIDVRLDLRAPLVLLGELARAAPMIGQARTLAEDVGDRYRVARSLAYEVQACFFAGRVDEVRRREAAADQATLRT